MSRRRFFQTAAGMAASYVAMNETFGTTASTPRRAEAATPEMAQERADGLKGQFIMDMHTHFLRDDTRLTSFVAMRNAVGKAGWNKELSGKEQTIDDLKLGHYVKEMFLDSDTKIALISSAPSDIQQDWFLTNQQMARAREKVNKRFGARRLFSHAIFTPGQPGWLEKIDAALALKPDSMKGYTIGDNTHKDLSRYPWRMDDEKVTYLGLREVREGRDQERLRAQGTVLAAGRRAVAQPARLRRRERCRAGGEGLAAAQLHHLSRRLPPRRRRPSGGAGRSSSAPAGSRGPAT